MRFQYFEPGILQDNELTLLLVQRSEAVLEKGWVPSYMFGIRIAGVKDAVGSIQLRVGSTPNIILYAGHIGYSVKPQFQGNRYAMRACRMLLPLAKRHNIKPLWITCNPENTASRKTCELLGAELVEIIDIPKDNDMYLEGERKKCRYKLEI